MSRTNKTLGLRNFEKDAERLRVLMGGGTTYLPPSAGGEMFNRIVVYHASGQPAQFFPVNDAGLAAAIAAVTGADTITIPPCVFANDYTLPANTSVLGTGSLVTKFSGTVTCGSNTYLRDVGIMRSVSSGSEIVGLLGPTTGEAYLNTVNINQANSGAGAATGIKMQAGNLKVRGSYSRGNASGGGAGYGVIGHATARFEFDEGCSFVGSTAKFSGGNLYGYGIENEVKHYDAAGELVRTYSATQAGLIAGLAAAASGDRIELPQDTIDLATGISVPAGVTLSGQGGYGSLSFTAFAGTAITLAGGASLQKLSINYDGTGQANALGISASGDSWLVQLCSVFVHGASGNNYGIECSGSTATVRAFIEFSHFHGDGGSNAHGVRVLSGGDVTIGYTTGFGTAGSSTSYGLQNASGSSAETIFEHCRFDGNTGSGARQGANNSGYGVFYSCILNGTTYGLSNSGTARMGNCEWSSLNGTVSYLQGDRGAYSVEDYHANDIEAAALTRHLPLPAVDGSDNTKIAIVSGHNWVMGDPSANKPVVVDYSTVNVDNPPTKEQIDAAFGLPAVVGAGFLGIINDNGSFTNQYLVYSDGFNWNYMNWAKAIATVAAALAILAGDTFTDTNGTALTSHTMDDGPGWTSVAGTWAVQSNTAQNSDNTLGEKIAVTDLGQADLKVRVRAKTVDQTPWINYFGGIVVRYSDSTHYWVVGVIPQANMVTIREVNGASITDRAYKTTLTGRYLKYTDIEVTCSGNTISATFDGGYGLSYTSTFNNTATKFGLFDHRDPGNSYKGWTFDDFQAVGLPTYSWTRAGTVLAATLPVENDTVLEPTVIYEGNARILSGNVFKMWYTYGGWGAQSSLLIGYAESTDGLAWTKYSGNPLLTGYARSHVLKNGSTYYLYASDGTNIDLYTSTDGLAWTLDTGNVLTPGAGGAWDSYGIENVFVWIEAAGDWRMLYESSSDTRWKIGYATSTDGRTWSKSGSNPVLAPASVGALGGPFVKKVGSDYFLFVHKAPDGGNLPTYIVRYKSSNLTSWTAEPMALIIPRLGSDEGEDTYTGQVADVSIVETGGVAYMFFSATSDGGSSSGNMHIELATADPQAVYGW